MSSLVGGVFRVADFNYVRAEMGSVLAGNDADDFRVKVTSDSGETKWMRITREQAVRIGEVLTEESGA